MGSKLLTGIFLAEKDKGREVPSTNRFKSDSDEKKKGKKAAAKPEPKAGPREPVQHMGRNGDEEDFPDLGAPQPAAQDLGYDTDTDLGGDDDYKSPFGALGTGGGSSWDNVPDWMRDPEQMPRADGGSSHIKGRAAGLSLGGDGPPMGKQKGLASLSPVGKPWGQRDVAKATGARKPGLLSRIFGLGRKKGPDWARDTAKGDHEQ